MGNSSDCHAAIKSSQRILHMHDRIGEAYSSSKYWKRYFYDMYLIIIVPHTMYRNSPEALCSLILRFLLLDGLTCNFLMLLVLAQLSLVVRETFFVSSSAWFAVFRAFTSNAFHDICYINGAHTKIHTYALVWPLAEFHLKIGTAMKRWTIFFKLQHRAIAHRAFSLLHLVIELEFAGCYIFLLLLLFLFYVFAVDHGKTGIWFSIDFASHVCHKNQIYMIYEM